VSFCWNSDLGPESFDLLFEGGGGIYRRESGNMAVVDGGILKGTSCWIILREGLGGCVMTSVRADAQEESSELQSYSLHLAFLLYQEAAESALRHPFRMEGARDC
jgi:hypothetical protein